MGRSGTSATQWCFVRNNLLILCHCLAAERPSDADLDGLIAGFFNTWHGKHSTSSSADSVVYLEFIYQYSSICVKCLLVLFLIRIYQTGDQRNNTPVGRGSGFLQPGEARRIHQHRWHSVDGCNDSPWRRTQRYPSAIETTFQHFQLYAAVKCFYWQSISHNWLRIFCWGMTNTSAVHMFYCSIFLRVMKCRQGCGNWCVMHDDLPKNCLFDNARVVFVYLWVYSLFRFVSVCQTCCDSLI